MKITINNKQHTVPTANELSTGAFIRFAESERPDAFGFLAAVFNYDRKQFEKYSIEFSEAQITRLGVYISEIRDPLAAAMEGAPLAPEAVQFLKHLGIYGTARGGWFKKAQNEPELKLVQHRTMFEQFAQENKSSYQLALFCLAMATRPEMDNYEQLKRIATSFENVPYKQALGAGAFFFAKLAHGYASGAKPLSVWLRLILTGKRYVSSWRASIGLIIFDIYLSWYLWRRPSVFRLPKRAS